MSRNRKRLNGDKAKSTSVSKASDGASDGRKLLWKHPVFRTVIRMRMAGQPFSKIAKRLNVSPQTLRKLQKKPEFQEAFSELDEEFFSEHDRMLKVAHHSAAVGLVQAVKKLQRLVRNADPHVSFRAIEILMKITETSSERAKDNTNEEPTAHTTINLLQQFEGSPEARQAARTYLTAMKNAETGTYEVQ